MTTFEHQATISTTPYKGTFLSGYNSHSCGYSYVYIHLRVLFSICITLSGVADKNHFPNKTVLKQNEAQKINFWIPSVIYLISSFQNTLPWKPPITEILWIYLKYLSKKELLNMNVNPSHSRIFFPVTFSLSFPHMAQQEYFELIIISWKQNIKNIYIYPFLPISISRWASSFFSSHGFTCLRKYCNYTQVKSKQPLIKLIWYLRKWKKKNPVTKKLLQIFGMAVPKKLVTECLFLQQKCFSLNE